MARTPFCSQVLWGKPLHPVLPMEPSWHGTVRTLYVVAFVLVWLESLGCFVFFLFLSRGGSPVATPELASGIVNHGQVFYVAAWKKQLYDVLLTVMMVGIPATMLTGLFLHHLVGVKIFTNR
jgi:hypothetical protein